MGFSRVPLAVFCEFRFASLKPREFANARRTREPPTRIRVFLDLMRSVRSLSLVSCVPCFARPYKGSGPYKLTYECSGVRPTIAESSGASPPICWSFGTRLGKPPCDRGRGAHMREGGDLPSLVPKVSAHASAVDALRACLRRLTRLRASSLLRPRCKPYSGNRPQNRIGVTVVSNRQ